MKIDKSQIVELLRVRGENDKASEAEGELPGTVDTEKDSELLARFGLDEEAIRGGLGDQLEGYGDRLGL